MSNSNITVTTSTSMDYAKIDRLTNLNGNPANIPLTYTNTVVKGEDLWKTDLVPHATAGLAHIFGVDIAQHLALDTIDFAHQLRGQERRYNAQTVEAQLLAWTKLVIAQKAKQAKSATKPALFMPMPIETNDRFLVINASLTMKNQDVMPNIAGIEMINAIGFKVPVTADILSIALISLAAHLNVENALPIISEAIKAKVGDYTKNCVTIGLLTQMAAKDNVDKFLVDSHVYEFMQKEFGETIADNVVSVNSNWNRFLEWKVEPKHVKWYLEQWVNTLAVKPNGAKHLEIATVKSVSGEKELHITFDGLHKLIVNNDGVFEADRKRQLYNAIVVTQQAMDYTNLPIGKNDVVYMNSYAVLLRYLVMNAGVFASTVPFTGKFFTKNLMNDLTFVSVEDTGEIDADRRMLEKSTTVTLTSQDFTQDGVVTTTLPFHFHNAINGVNMLHLEPYKVGNAIKATYVASHRLDEVAFVELNLARSKKHFIDGRRVALQAKFIPQEFRTDVLKVICCEAYSCKVEELEKFIYEDFTDLIAHQYTSEELWNYLGINLVFGLSSKLSKLVKRTIMYAAQIGKLMEGEDVHLKQRGQKISSVNCQAVKSIVSAFHCAAQGMAETFKHDNQGYLFNHLVPHRIERKLSLRPVAIAANQKGSVKLDLENYLGNPSSQETNDTWTSYKFEHGIPKNIQEQILAMPFQVKGSLMDETLNFNLFNEVEGALVTEIKVRFAALAGNIKQVQLQVELTTLEHNVKIRGINKAMSSNAPLSTVFNALNPDLSESAVDAIFYKDTNKWLDTTLNLLPMVYMTAHKNAEVWPEGVALIKEIDSLSETEDTWSPLLDLMGVYKPLRAAFDAKFGKETLWVQHEEENCTVEQSSIALQFRMYDNAANQNKGWNQLSTLPDEVFNAIPKQYTNVAAYIQGEENEYDNNKVNIQIFAYDDSECNWYTAQRSRVYMGTAECPLYMPVKAEMASVRSLIGTSPAMGGMVRNVATHDSEFASKMMSKNFKGYNKFAGFLAMARSASIQPKEGEKFSTVVLNPVNNYSENGGNQLSSEAIKLLRTDKVREIFKATEETGTFLLELSKHFNNVNFVILTDEIVKEDVNNSDEIGTRIQSSFSLYLPIIVAQSSASNYRTTDDLSSNVQTLFTNLLFGSDWVTETEYGMVNNKVTYNLCNRIGGAIKSLAKTQGIAKCAAFGVMGVMAKPTAIYGVPLNEVYIKKNSRYDSVYKTLLRTFNLAPSQLNGFPVMFGRSPMTAMAKVQIRVIDNQHPMFDYINEDGFTFNPLACYYHRGDYDGDLNFIFPAIIDGVECQMPYLTVSSLVASIDASTGN